MTRYVSIILALLMVVTPFTDVAHAVSETDSTDEATATEPTFPVLITEVYPNDLSNNGKIEGAGENDLFEFVEIYNNTEEAINFNDAYKIRYNYISNQKDLNVTHVEDETNTEAMIPANSPAVLWVERTSSKITGVASELTEQDFRDYHNISADVPVYKVRGQDGLNNSERGFLITEKDDSTAVIAEAFYSDDDVADGKSLHTRVPKKGTMLESYLQRAEPTPGQVNNEQLVPTKNIDPVITHEPVSSLEAGEALPLTAVVQDEDEDPLTVKLSYKTNPYADFTEVQMERGAEHNYSYTIPADQLNGNAVYYRMEATDGEATVETPEYTVEIIGKEAEHEIPRILITEMAPHPAGDYRKGSGNQYEFMEIYNNSDESLNLKDYTLFYLYPHTSKTKQWTIPYDTNIEPYSTAVVWFAKEAVKAGYTEVEDFNTHFNTTLDESDVLFYDNSNSSDFNLPNTLHRGFAISSSNSMNDVIVSAWYDASSASSTDSMLSKVRNSVVRYTYPEQGKEMKRLDNRVFANPGNIDEGQVPNVEGKDIIAPVMEHDQEQYVVEKNSDVSISFTSDEKLHKAEVIYGDGSTEKTTFTGSADATLVSEQDGTFVYEANLNIAEAGVYRYMVVGEDASNNITKLPHNSLGNTLTVKDEVKQEKLPEKGLSLKDGAILNQSVGFYAYGEQATDDIQVTMDSEALELRRALPGNVQFGFQGNGIDHIYQTSASANDPSGERDYFARIYPKYVENVWYMYDMSPDHFVSGSTVAIHAGSENVPYDLDVHDQYFNKINFDDFNVKNIHIVLPDGTMVKPEQVTSYLGNRTVSTLPYTENMFYSMGDGGAPTNTNMNKPLKNEFEFAIPEDKYIARYAEIDTTAYTDGVYAMDVSINNDFNDEISVTIDNTNPEIKGITYEDESYIKDEELLKGKFVFDVDATDNLSGIEEVEATLDGEKVTLPYETSSAKLTPGEHELNVKVLDGAGNESIESVTFQIGTETPNDPENVSPEDLTDGVTDVTLEAIVKDPSADRMDVEFFKGSKYDFSSGKNIKGFINNADREPPLTLVPEGETTIDADNQAKIAAEDGEYLISDTEAGFPYHRFEVEVGEEIADDSVVELYWKGKTLPNRIVTMYAWDYNEEKWIALKSETGDDAESDIVLTAEVDVSSYVKDGKVQAMVQDEVENPNDPFTMLWWTDTQYYAEFYPNNFDHLGDWIAQAYTEGQFEYAIHTGDLVNKADSDAQWEIADRNLKKLEDANVPYGVLAGNHDVIIDGVDYSYYHKYVGADRYQDKPWYGGDMDNNRNHYDLISFGGHDFIVLYLGFGTEDTEETLTWANEVLEKHSDRNAILAMHAYLEYSATLSNMAQTVFDEVIETNDNVLMAIGGHYHGAAKRISTVTNSDGTERKVIEMLADYQGAPNGGDGYVRYLTFDPIKETLDVVTYSPILDDYNFFEPEKDSFTESIQLQDINKRVATDYFSVNVYTNELIGKEENVASGDTVSVDWKGLDSNQEYHWYMNITDELGATRRSDIFRFTTGEIAVEGPGENPGEDPDEGKDPEEKPGDGADGDGNSGNEPGSNDGNKDSNKGKDQTDDNKDAGGDEVTDKDTNKVTQDPSDKTLPETATNIFNWLLVGFAFVVIGGGIVYIRRKKRKTE